MECVFGIFDPFIGCFHSFQRDEEDRSQTDHSSSEGRRWHQIAYGASVRRVPSTALGGESAAGTRREEGGSSDAFSSVAMERALSDQNLLAYIFIFLDTKDRGRMARVCKNFLKAESIVEPPHIKWLMKNVSTLQTQFCIDGVRFIPDGSGGLLPFSSQEKQILVDGLSKIYTVLPDDWKTERPMALILQNPIWLCELLQKAYDIQTFMGIWS